MTRNVFVVGADAFNLEQVKTVPAARDCEFHTLSSFQEAKGGEEFPVADILDKARRTLRAFFGSIDAIVGWWDFPVSTMLPILRREFDLPTPSLESLLKCEHKYWSRLEQRRCIPGHVPEFQAVDPFAGDAVESLQLAYPFWIKPVKSASSYLGFKVHNEKELREVLATTRDSIHRLAEPFNVILDHAELPAEVAGIDGWHCIAEAIISRGRQCTLEGYVHRGEVHVYGVIDSKREGRHRSSFSRYQYPSAIPRRVQLRMIELTAQFMEHIGFDDSPFNIEYYWDEKSGAIWLLEVNARISKSHAPLFRMVDGQSHHQIMLDVALGNRPPFPYREGPHKLAAKFMLRRYEDAAVRRVPSQADIDEVRRRFPGAEVLVHVDAGQRLSELKDQDSYSYEVGVLFIGAEDQHRLLDHYREALDILGFEFSD